MDNDDEGDDYVEEIGIEVENTGVLLGIYISIYVYIDM
jgi:hypothetical protein